MRVDELIKQAVDELGQELPPRSGLADIALRASRRRRHAARAAAAGGTALAVGLAAVTVSAWPTDPVAAPERGTTVASLTSVRIDLDKLPKGAPPAVPWFGIDGIRDGDRRVAFSGDFEGHRRLRKVAGGYAILVRHRDKSLELFLVRPGGTRVSLGRGMHDFGVSASGRLVAFATSTDDATTLAVVDTTTGQRIAERTVGDRKLHRGKVVGFLDEHRIVIDDVLHGPARVYLWNSRAKTVNTWTRYQMISELSASGRLAAFTADQGTDIVRTGTGRVLWNSREAELTPEGFAPDDRHLALLRFVPRPVPPVNDDPAAVARFNQAYRDAVKQFVIVDASSGRPVLQIDVQHPDVARSVWESDRTFVFEAFKGDKAALVRCTLDGRCELATTPVRVPGTRPADHLDGHT